MKYILIIPGVCLFFITSCFSQNFSAFPEETPRRWGGAGIIIPDVGISLQVYPRAVPLLLRPQLDFGIFQNHGHPVTGGKVTIAYVTPFTTLGVGRAYIGGIVGHNVDRISDRQRVNDHRVLEEDKIFLWGGVLGEKIELLDNLYLSGEIRFLNKQIETTAIDPENFFDKQTVERFRTTWMIGLQYYFW